MTTTTLPTEFLGSRFFVRPVTTSGIALRLFTDTGGGMVLVESAVDRLGLRRENVRIGDDAAVVVALPEFSTEAWIPPVSVDQDPRRADVRGKLFVRDGRGALAECDGILGQEWFGGRVWTFDYASGQLLLHDAAPGPRSGHAGLVPLGFPRDSHGRPRAHFPSVEATIDGETYAFLFDTGATVRLAPSARRAAGFDAAEQATCFITGTVFDSWRRRHPDWRVIDEADVNARGECVMEVPSVEIADHIVGPVWFTRRADGNFHEYMSSMMDRRVEGALGGSLFRYFVITVDYPQAIAHFEQQVA